MVSVKLPNPMIEAGLKAAAAPLGRPDTVKETVPLNPLIPPMVAV